MTTDVDDDRVTAATTEARAAAAYRLVLPAGWQRVALDATADASIDGLVRAALRRLPPGTPPDDLARLRHQLRARLGAVLRDAADAGGVDLLLPVEPVAGVALPVSVVVSLVAVPGPPAGVVAALLADDPEARAVAVGPVVGVRTTAVDETSVRVTHLVPGVHGGWWAAITAQVQQVDGGTEVLVDLVDAIVSTWRWEA